MKASSFEKKGENFENLFKPDFQNLIEVQGEQGSGGTRLYAA
jgi:hypothetical protein